MKLTRSDYCPLGKDLQPGSKICEKCSFFIAKEWNEGAYEVECTLANIREKMLQRIREHTLSGNLWDFADELWDIVIEADVLKENEKGEK